MIAVATFPVVAHIKHRQYLNLSYFFAEIQSHASHPRHSLPPRLAS